MEHWGEHCDEGRRQSPVDLATEASVHGIFPSFTFADYDESIMDAAVVNTGHSGKIFFYQQRRWETSSNNSFLIQSRLMLIRVKRCS